MAAPGAFVPKQAMTFDAKLFEIIGADETAKIAEHELTLIPPLPAEAVVHDSACGLGAVTQALVASKLADTVKIEATDVAQSMVGIYNTIAAGNKWPAQAKEMDVQKLTFADGTFSHSFLSFGLPILSDPVAAAKELHRTTKAGGTAITAFWLQIPQGECAGDTRRAVWGSDASLAVEPNPKHKDRDYIKSLLIEGGFAAGDIELHEKAVKLPVKDLDEFAGAIWTAIGQPPGGWTQNDEDKWDEAVAKYKELLPGKSGFSKDADGNITLEAIAQIAVAKKA